MNRVINHLICFVLFLAVSLSSVASERIYVQGFVEQLCSDELHCFDLKVEHEYVIVAGKQVRVHFSVATTIYDSENYQLSIEQSNIVAGSHLRLLLDPGKNTTETTYHAVSIWMGD